MRRTTRTVITGLAVALALGSAVTAEARIYNIVIGGKATPFDCPESPQGHTLTWVNQNCTQQRVQHLPSKAPVRADRKS
jgi:hypothetical protein